MAKNKKDEMNGADGADSNKDVAKKKYLITRATIDAMRQQRLAKEDDVDKAEPEGNHECCEDEPKAEAPKKVYVVNRAKLEEERRKRLAQEEADAIVFDDDQAFFDWGVNPELKIIRDDNGVSYYDWDYSPAYYQAIEQGKTIYIVDNKSLINKRKEINYRTITKKIDNLGDYMMYKFKHRIKDTNK